MKCHYRIDDGAWVKGTVQTLQAVDVCVTPEDRTADPKLSVMFRDPEILFDSTYIRLTGYQQVDGGLYKLISVDISPGWRDPG